MSGASQSSMASQLDRLATLYQQNLLTEQAIMTMSIVLMSVTLPLTLPGLNPVVNVHTYPEAN